MSTHVYPASHASREPLIMGGAPAAVFVQVLQASDAAVYNAFLRVGLEAHPDTLRISVGDLVSVPFVPGSDEEGATFVALSSDGAWLGVSTLERDHGREKRRHIAWVVRMYVSASRAGGGVGRALLKAATARARELPGVTKLNLTVAAHNERAVRLYESEGFRAFAREEDAFRDSQPRAELTMSLSLVSG